MNTDQVWEVLGKIPVGTIVAWGMVVCSIIFAIYKAISKLYGVFKGYEAKEKESEELKKIIHEHDTALGEVNQSLAEIKKSLSEQKEVNLKQIRHTIVHTCDDALAAGYITAGKLKSLEEMFEEYTVVFHANGYVRTLVKKTRELPVRGKLDA